ncbi:MAG: class I adenylate-forming enzyme family protein [Acidimicrobiales bacterium]
MTADRSLVGLLDAAVAADPDRVALVVDDRTTTYSELEMAVTSSAEALRSAGVRPGHRLPLADDATVMAVATVIAAARLGAAATLMNPRLTPAELADLVEVASTGGPSVAGPAAVPRLTEAGCTPVLDAEALLGGPSTGTAPAAVPAGTSYVPRPTDEAVVLFTSGTTGTPKAVPFDHELIDARIAAYAPTVDKVPAVSLLSVPFVHVGGMLGTLIALARGSTVVTLARFDAARWLICVERYRVTSSFVVPTMLHRILGHPDLATTDLSSLTLLTYGAAPASSELITRARSALPGVGLANTFGQTETAGSITTLPPGDHPPERLASVGRPLPGVEIRIVDPASGSDVSPGSTGELWVKRDPRVAARALGPGLGVSEDAEAASRNPPEPASSRDVPPPVGGDPPGWLRTGDLVSADAEGYLYPEGRLSDTINRGGEKFSPGEVEQVVNLHPQVRDVAVFGVPDPEMGQRVGAAVVSEDRLTEEELRDFCRAHLAAFKLPERLVVVEELPYNDYGKVDRKALRSLVEAADP